MGDSYLQEAFNQVCTEARQCESWYVVLVECVPYYGGPEEGGWWGHDYIVQAYQEYPSEELARRAAKEVEKLASELSGEARNSYGQHCLDTVDWCEKRGLDASYLPEPDGPSEFSVHVTQEVPQDSRGCRQYS